MRGCILESLPFVTACCSEQDSSCSSFARALPVTANYSVHTGSRHLVSSLLCLQSCKKKERYRKRKMQWFALKSWRQQLSLAEFTLALAIILQCSKYKGYTKAHKLCTLLMSVGQCAENVHLKHVYKHHCGEKSAELTIASGFSFMRRALVFLIHCLPL